MKKTNAMRILDTNKIQYKIYEYELDGEFDSAKVAQKIGKSSTEIYKTLVCIGKSKQYYVFIIPIDNELDLKLAAAKANEKSITMITVKEINTITGYIRGGCSPIGMKKVFTTFCEEQALKLPSLIISGGRIGLQIEMNVQDLQKVLPITFASLIK